ncbi:unnamed protein product [Urochloa humidicola]
MASSSARSPRASTPPNPSAGDPPEASNTTSPRSGDPPAATPVRTPQSPPVRGTPEGRSLLHKGEALDLKSCSSGSTSSNALEVDCQWKELQKVVDSRGKGIVFTQEEETGPSQLGPVTSAGGKLPFSYKDALVGAKTFKPRFENTKRTDEWMEHSARRRPAPATVWARLGTKKGGIHDRLGTKQGGIHGHEWMESAHGIIGILPLLRARAVGRCFNCFARDHRIAQCRDPPCCVLCSRSGHKARFCPTRCAPPAPGPVWRRRVPAAGAPAPATKKTMAVPTASDPAPATKKLDAAPPLSMDFDADRRPARVSACAARSGEIREAERDLRLHSLIAVQMDARAHLSCEGVLRNALQQLRIPTHALRVSRLSTTAFLLNFESLEMRNAAHSCGELSSGPAALHLMPWGRQFSGTISHLFYRARVCLEGVPVHAQNAEAVMHLLPKQSFVEQIDYEKQTEDEKGCFILWIWCNDPEAVAVQGTLKIEEPLEFPREYFGAGGSSQLPVERIEAVPMMQYNVIIHLDRFEDYSTPSFNSSQDHTPEWPARHRLVWHLGQLDILPDPPRVSALSRLGGRRDCSSPRGGGAGGAGGGPHQVPPLNQYDFASSVLGQGAGSSMQRGYGDAGMSFPRYYRGCGGEVQAEDTKKKKLVLQDAELKALVVPRNEALMVFFDPMMEEIQQFQISSNAQGMSGGDIAPTGSQREMVEFVSQGTKESNLVGVVVEEAHEAQTVFVTLQNKVMQDMGPSGNAEAEQLASTRALPDDIITDVIDETTENSPPNMMKFSSVLPSDINMGKLNDIDPVPVGKGRKGQKVAKESSSCKITPRGISRFAVPLKKSLLCNPTIKPKNGSVKKSTGAVDASAKQVIKDNQVLPVEEKATMLLMKASGIMDHEDEAITEEAQEKFGGQFFGHLESGTMGNMRNALGMPGCGGADVFSALLADDDA